MTGDFPGTIRVSLIQIDSIPSDERDIPQLQDLHLSPQPSFAISCG
jgi:hypothetical protein